MHRKNCIIRCMLTSKFQNIAATGAGIAGANCTGALTLARHTVHVFDKSRGPGGRLATCRVEWVDRRGQACTTRLAHGAIGITACSETFQTVFDQALHAGWLAKWAPMLVAGSLLPEDSGWLYRPAPDMPSLCRRLLDSAYATWSFAVDSPHKGPLGWQAETGGGRHRLQFDAVVLTLPPGQAAPFLSSHGRYWDRHASVVPMQSCWTLMGIADASKPALGWELAEPSTGPLAWVLRNNACPGRARVLGQAYWVAHARAAWSRRHFEQPAAWVQQQMQAALPTTSAGLSIGMTARCTAGATRCRRRTELHRPNRAGGTLPRAWASAETSLAARARVERTWLSEQSRSVALLQHAADAADASTAFAPH